MIMDDLNNYSTNERVPMKCDICDNEFQRFKKYIRKLHEKYNNDLCLSCSTKESVHKKPQCSKKYWTADKKQELSVIIKNSEIYKESRKKLNNSGENNAMFGKKHSDQTRQKMSESRTGKIGKNATAWKGGKKSITARIKNMLQTRYNWFGRIFDRDKCICQKCGGKGKDAHHIIPIVVLIKNLLIDKKFSSDDEKVLWLIDQPEIRDDNLKNGICLCRDCHKKEHNKWGSHNNP